MRDSFNRARPTPQRARFEADLEQNDRFGAAVTELVAHQLAAHAEALRVGSVRAEVAREAGAEPDPVHDARASDRLELVSAEARAFRLWSERSAIEAPETKDDEVIVYGRVARADGQGVAKLVVSLVAGATEVIDFAKTGARGEYTVHLAPGDVRLALDREADESSRLSGPTLALRVVVADPDGEVLHRDEAPMRLTIGTSVFREILLD